MTRRHVGARSATAPEKEMHVRVVVVVDTQADFMNPDGALAVAGADALAAPMGEWLRGLAPAQWVDSAMSKLRS